MLPKAAAKDRREIFGNRRRRSRRRPFEQVLFGNADTDANEISARNDKQSPQHDSNDQQEQRQQQEQKQPLKHTSSTSEPSGTLIPATPNNSTDNLHISVDTFLNDAQALLRSAEMSRLIHSSSHLLSTAAGTALHVSLLPVTVPMDVAQSATSAVVHTVGQSVDLVGAVIQGAVPLAIGVTETIASSVMGVVLPLIGFNQSSGQSTSSEEEMSCSTPHHCTRPSRMPHSGGEKTCEASDASDASCASLAASAASSRSSSQDDLTMFHSFSPGTENAADARIADTSPTSESSRTAPPSVMTPTAAAAVPSPLSSSPRKLRRTVSSFMRICDLQLTDAYLEIRPYLSMDAFSASAIDALTARGLALATQHPSSTDILPGGIGSHNNNPPLPRWHPEGSTAKLLERASESEAHFVRVLEKEVLLWHAKMDESVQYGRNVPMFKSRGIVNMDPKAFTELLMDSDRVQTYNKYSGGRTDEVVLQSGIESYSNNYGHGETKIVRSENKIPFASRSVVLWNLMHSRRLDGGCSESYIIVSRSVSRTGKGAQDKVSEIVWGVNVLQSVDGHPGKTDLTCVSQVGQSVVPGFVQHKLALAALCEVYKSTRALCK